jgi:hypothetical protein
VADHERDCGKPTWKAISGILGGAKVSQQYITALAMAPSDPKTIYAATADGHMWATTDGGSNWMARDSGMFGMGGGKIVDIRIDPKNPSRAFAVGAGQGSVWYLDTVGGSLVWTNISGDLPSYLRSGTIFADWRFATPALYLGTSRGVYHSVNLGAHWSVFALDMPNTVVSDLESATQDVLVAATIGRGAWAILVPSSSISGKITMPLEPGVVRPGDPVEGVTIMLDAGGGAREHMPTTVTNARGRYAFEKVPPGTYTVRRIAPPGYSDTCSGPERITLNPAVDSRRGGNFASRFATIAGGVSPAAGVRAGSVAGRADIFAVPRSGCDTSVALRPTAPLFLAT